MEQLVLFALFALVLLCGPWVAVWLLRTRIRALESTFEERVGNLTRRMYDAESVLQQLRQKSTSFETSSPTAEQSPIGGEPTPTEVVERQKIEPAVSLRVAASPPQTRPPQPIPVEIAPVPPPIPPASEPTFAAREIAPALAEKIREGGGIEEVLGKNWLNKLGIVLLVIGVAFFLAYQLQTLGPTGKVLVGYTVSLALLGAGIWFERNDRYRILARAGIAGGWALLFFTTYAMYHVPAAHVLASQSVDLVLMLIVALAMVWHTLRYNSQVVTGLAFLLAYSTIFISRVSVYSLTAGVVLAIGIAVIALQRNWLELEVFGILASYLNHYFWLRPIIEPMGAHKHPFAEFIPSATILLCCWVIFRISYVVRSVTNDREEQISTVAALLNSALLLCVLKYQSVHPEWAFWVLLAIGAVEMTLGQLPITKRRRMAFIVLSTIGAVLLVAAIPFRYSGAHVSVLWLIEAEALFLVGLWTSEILFARLGLLATFAMAGQILASEAARVFGRRMDSADLAPDYRVGLFVVGVAAAALYANAHHFSRRWANLFSRLVDRRLLFYSSYSAAFLAVVSLWMVFPELWTAVAWSAFALALAILGKYLTLDDLAVQANAISAIALLRVLAVNFESTQKFHHVSLRLVSIATVAILYYVTSRWTGFATRARQLHVPDAYTWTASALVTALMWYELQPISVALAWCLFGVLLFEIGVHQRKPALRWQAYVALASGFVRLFFVSLNAQPEPGHLSARVYSILPLAVAFFYVYTRRKEFEQSRFEHYLLNAQSWMGTATVAALVRFELPPNWVVTGWAALVVVLFAIASLLKDRIFQEHAVVVIFGVLFRSLFHNFYSRGSKVAFGWSISGVAAFCAVIALFISLVFAFSLRQFDYPRDKEKLRRFWNVLVYRPEQIAFFVPLVILTVLLAVEMRSGLITVSWGIEAVAVFLFALWASERSFRLSGLALLLLCVGKIVVIDVWGLNPRDRYITLIIMGIALLLVSFLYTRFRETIKAYL